MWIKLVLFAAYLISLSSAIINLNLFIAFTLKTIIYSIQIKLITLIFQNSGLFSLIIVDNVYFVFIFWMLSKK